MGKKPFREGGPSLVEEDQQMIADKNGMSLIDAKRKLTDQLNCKCDHNHKPAEKKADKPLLSDHDMHHLAEGWGMTEEEAHQNICWLLCHTMK